MGRSVPGIDGRHPLVTLACSEILIDRASTFGPAIRAVRVRAAVRAATPRPRVLEGGPDEVRSARAKRQLAKTYPWLQPTLLGDSMKTLERMRVDIADLVRCPYPWSEERMGVALVEFLEYQWEAAMDGLQVQAEARYWRDGQVDEDRLELTQFEELRADLYNLRQWIPAARSKYLHESHFFQRLRWANTDDYNKHFAAAGATRREIIAATAGSIQPRSLFQFSAESGMLEEAMWHLVTRKWAELIDSATERGLPGLPRNDATKHGCTMADVVQACGSGRHFVRFDLLIGAARGQETPFVAYEFDVSTNVAHGFPVLEAEARGHSIHASRYIAAWSGR